MIRKLKHSHLLEKDINELLRLKYTGVTDDDEMINGCNFLFTHYTDLYNKVKKDEIDLKILNRFLNILRNIEDGEIDQHEGSYLIGSLLKQLYIDSALKKANKLPSIEEEEEENRIVSLNISYKDFKKI
jgi:hypothetical protein